MGILTDPGWWIRNGGKCSKELLGGCTGAGKNACVVILSRLVKRALMQSA